MVHCSTKVACMYYLYTKYHPPPPAVTCLHVLILNSCKQNWSFLKVTFRSQERNLWSLGMHKAKRTPRQILSLPSVSWPRSRKYLGVHFALCNRSLIWQRMRGIHAYLRKAPNAIAALPQVTLHDSPNFVALHCRCCSGTWISPRNASLPRWILLIFGVLLVRTLINFWSSFYKNDTVRFQEIPISLSCCLSEIDHLAWMTCLSTSTRDGRWRPKTRFYALNIISQSPWDIFFSNCKKEYPQDLVFFFGLSSLSNRS